MAFKTCLNAINHRRQRNSAFSNSAGPGGSGDMHGHGAEAQQTSEFGSTLPIICFRPGLGFTGGLARGFSVAILPDELEEQIVLRVRMPEVLPIRLGGLYADLATAPATPFLHLIQVLVDAVLFEQPPALAFMTREHIPFQLHPARDVDMELRCDW